MIIMNTLEDDLLVAYRELALLEEQMAVYCDYFPEEDDIEDYG
jgi:hypothetical protein